MSFKGFPLAPASYAGRGKFFATRSYIIGRRAQGIKTRAQGIICLMISHIVILFIWASCPSPVFYGVNRAISNCVNNAIHALGFCAQWKGNYYV